VSSINEGQLFELLEQALRSQLVREEFVPGKDQYSFTHGKIREVIYDGISPRRRKRYHETVAVGIEETNESLLEAGACGEGVCSLLSHHYGLGEEWEKSLHYSMKAGVHAKEVYAIKDSIRYFEKAKEILGGGKLLKDEVWVEEKRVAIILKLGEVYQVAGEYESAIQDYNSLLTSTDPKTKGEALSGMSDVYGLQGNFEEAMNLALESKGIFQELDNAEGVARSMNALGKVQARLGNYEESLKHHQGSMKIRKDSGDRKGESSSMNNIGNVLDYLGKTREALKWLQEALRIRREIGDRFGVAAILNNIGAAHIRKGETGEALEVLKESYAIRKEIGDKGGQAISTVNIGNVHFQKSEYGRALKAYQESLELSKEIGDKWDIAMISSNIGNVYFLMCDYDEALKRYQESFLLRKEIGDKHGMSACLHNLGEVLYQRGDFEKAFTNFENSLVIQKEIQSKKGLAQTLTSIGKVHQSLNDFEKALEYHKESLALAKEIGAKDVMSEALTGIGVVMNNMGDFENSVRTLNETLESTELSEGSETAMALHEGLSEIWISIGDLEKAEKYCELYRKGAEERNLLKDIAKGKTLMGEIRFAKVLKGNADHESAVRSKPQDKSQPLMASPLIEAEKELLEALKIAEEIRVSPLLWKINTSLGKVYSHTGDKVGESKAIDHLTKAKETVRELAGKIEDSDLKNTFLNSKPIKELNDMIRQSLKKGFESEIKRG
jgi:tetratricopeptide (TPR) repeat protein